MHRKATGERTWHTSGSIDEERACLTEVNGIQEEKKDRTEHGFGYTDKGQSLDSSMERKMTATKEEAAGMKSLVRRRSILRISDRNLLGEEEQNIKGRHNAGSRFRCDSKPPTLVVSKTS